MSASRTATVLSPALKVNAGLEMLAELAGPVDESPQAATNTMPAARMSRFKLAPVLLVFVRRELRVYAGALTVRAS